MKKQKLLSLLLAVTMVLAMIPAFVVSTAAETTHIDLSNYEDKSTYVGADGKSYTVIKTLDTFKSEVAITYSTSNTSSKLVDKCFILGADIVWDGSYYCPIRMANGIFDGNGYSITGISVLGAEDVSDRNTRYAGVFQLYPNTNIATVTDAFSSLTIRNLTIGQEDDLVYIASKSNQTGGLIGHTVATTGFSLNVENVTINAYIYALGGERNCAGFVASVAFPATFDNCVFNGVVDIANSTYATSNAICFVNSTNATVTNCKSNALLINKNQNIYGLENYADSSNIDNSVKINLGAQTDLDLKVKNIGAVLEASAGLTNEQKAYNLRQAQIAGGDVAGNYVGYDTTNAKFVIGTSTVESVNTRVGSEITDKLYTVLKSGVAESDTYVQTQDRDDGLQNVRVLTLVAESEIASSLNWSFTMMTSENDGYTLHVGANAISLYTSVLGGDYVYDTPEGYVLLAVEIEGVDSEWNGKIADVTLKVVE